MSAGDFLRKDAQTPLTKLYSITGVLGAISTNGEAILEAAHECFCPAQIPAAQARLSLRFWVDPKGTTKPPWPKPFFRGHDHLVFAGFDTQSSVLIDLRHRHALGRFSPAMAADRAYWKTVILPVLVSILGASAGITELHCGCVAKNGQGLLLAGRSGSGKSTLALALARAGYGYVSDDRTFCSESNGRLSAWGLPTLLKLRPEAAGLFRGFQGLEPNAGPGGERAFFVDPDNSPDFNRVHQCDPLWLVFLERREEAGFDLAPILSAEAARLLEGDLIAEAPEAAELQQETIGALVSRPCWRLRYGRAPQEVAEELAHCFEKEKSRNSVRNCAEENATTTRIKVNAARHDPLRRFAPTPYSADLPVMGRTIRLETNSQSILENTCRVLECYRNMRRGYPDFQWKIIVESQAHSMPPWPEISAFSGQSLRFINIGQRNFIAVDLEARQAVAVLAEGLAGDPQGFRIPFLDDLFCLTAGALGLTPLTAACVASGDKGILILGPPKSGKTTTSYLAGKAGLEFFADQEVFLEVRSGQLRAWGDFLPTVFRPEMVQFIPELQKTGHPFRYLELTFLCVDRSCSHEVARPLEPICCVFLRHQPSLVPHLAPLLQKEFCRRVTESFPFRDDDRFVPLRTEVLTALEKLPSYELAFGTEFSAATRIYRNLLLNHPLLARMQ